MHKVFLDTNVLLDVLMQRNGFESAKFILLLARHHYFAIQASTLTMANIAYIFGRHVPKAVLYETYQSYTAFLDVVSVTDTAYQSAMAERWDDFEDALQHFSAVEAQADCIVTRNTRDFAQSSIPAMTPEDFLDAIDVEH